MRALWNQTLDDPATRHVLFTGESAVLEAIYISGPVLIVAGIGGLISIPAAALACGVLRPARDADVRRHARPRARGARRPTARAGLVGALASPGVRTLLGTLTVVGAGVGIIEVAVPALCERAGHAERDRLRARPVGPRQPRRRRRGEPPRRGRGPRAARDRAARRARGRHRCRSCSRPASSRSAALIFVAGIAIAPALAAVHSLTGQLAAHGTVTEAYTWLGTGMGAGIAIGAALGGAVVEGAGTGEAFVLAACAVALARRAGRRPAVEPPAGLKRQTTRPEPEREVSEWACWTTRWRS